MRFVYQVLLSVIVVMVLGLAVPSFGRVDPPQPPPVDPELDRLPISAMLYNLADRIASDKSTGPEFVKFVQANGFLGRRSGLVNVEIVNREGDVSVDGALIRAHGGQIDAVWRGQTSAWLPPSRAADLARALPKGYFLRHANLAQDNNEGPATMNSETYADPLPAGFGITAGIIDRNFMGLAAAETAGVVPTATRHNYPGGDFEGTFSVHGVAHLETVFDHAPLADYHLFKIANSTHLGVAVDDAIALDVNVLSATQSFYNEGWADNTGAAAQAAYHAATNGIIYVSSSGNRAQTHWQGPFDYVTLSDWLDWDGNDDWQNDLGAIADGNGVNIYMQWNRYGSGPNYDLYLYDAGLNVVASSTTGSDGFEQISWTNNTGGTVTVSMAVQHVSGTPVELEVFLNNGPNFEHQTPESSLTSPNNNTAANCLVIGAVPYTSYSNWNLMSYSSRGPTNSGARGIDLVGPTNTTTVAYGGAYGGTSCSTPNVAGATVALWSSAPDLGATGVRYLVTHLAELYNDWGASGPDSDYGYGGLFLPTYQVHTEWVDRWAVNVAGNSTLPWYYVSDAEAGSLDGGRLLFLGGGYPETLVLDEERTYESVVEGAVIGADE